MTIFSYILAFISVIIGFYKMFAYELGSEYTAGINAYVGGDAYNYIINANYSTAFFVLSLVLVVFGSALAIVRAINER